MNPACFSSPFSSIPQLTALKKIKSNLTNIKMNHSTRHHATEKLSEEPEITAPYWHRLSRGTLPDTSKIDQFIM